MLLRSYPRSFREEFGEDLVSLFDDLTVGRGRAAAWWICGIDLLVTLPRLHLERIMNHTQTTSVINWTIALLTTAGAASLLTGAYPGALLLLVAGAFGVSHRGSLARAVRVPDSGLRRRRFVTAAVLATVFVICYLLFLVTVGDTWNGGETALALTGTTSMIGSGVYLVAGLLTPRSPGVTAVSTP